MPRGGPRPGSGRPRGLPDKPKRVAQSEWSSSVYGLPTKRMLIASNWWFNEFATQQKKPEAERDRGLMIQAFEEGVKYAAMAAPYIERRLASITHQVMPYDFSRLTDQELAELERIIRTATGTPSAGSVDDGEEATRH